MDKNFYKKWKAKSMCNRQLFLENSDISRIETDKIFSAGEQPNSQFSLRLSSESFVDETQESPESSRRDKQAILISDSSSDESLQPSSSKTSNPPPIAAFVPYRACEVEHAESSSSSQNQSPVQRHQTSEITRTPRTGPLAKAVLIEDSGSDEGEHRAVHQQAFKNIEPENATLSERKKKEILHWLTNNFHGMSCGSSSCSQDSVVSDSRKSATSSGNSSLERLEMNYETPNNRGKLSRLTESEKSRENGAKRNGRLSRLDQFFEQSKLAQLDIVRDKTPGSKNSDKTPTNVIKLNPRRIIRTTTPVSAGSDKTLTSHVRSTSGKIRNNKTSASKSYDKTLINNSKMQLSRVVKDMSYSNVTTDKRSPFETSSSQINSRQKNFSESPLSESVEDSEEQFPLKEIQNNVIISESESFESKESVDVLDKLNANKNKNSLEGVLGKLNCKNSDVHSNALKTLSDVNHNVRLDNGIHFKKPIVMVPDVFEITDDIDSLRQSSNLLKKGKENNLNQVPRNSALTETKNSSNSSSIDILRKTFSPYSRNQFFSDKQTRPVNEIFEITNDVDHSDKSVEHNLQINEIQQKFDQSALMLNTTSNTTVNDCANILENLYGEEWRNRAKTLISSSGKQAQPFVKNVQTERKIPPSKPQFSFEHNEEKDVNILKKTKNISKKNRPQDNVANGASTTESSPDCSYYTAVSNPAPCNNNLPPVKTAPGLKINNENNKNTVIAICDSDSSDYLEDVNDNWKINPIRRRLSFDSSSSSITSEFDPDDIVPPKNKVKTIKFKKLLEIEAKKNRANHNFVEKFAKKSFLASLSKEVPLYQADFKAMTYRNKYNVLKEELCKFLFKLFNEKVFDNRLPEDMLIEWSVRLTGTAGKCYNKQSIKTLGKAVKSSRIVLAAKVLDTPERLRDTLIHEMCHAATWLINNVSDGHGRFWKAWACKAMKVFPELPPITRCHDYQVQTKYTYKCTTCGYSIGRHSKSLNLNTKRCGYCHGKFELLINKMTKNGKVQMKSRALSKQLTGFALYVKENYNVVKKSGAATKHGEVMKLLGQQFSAIKLMPKPGERCRNNNDDESP